MICEMCGKNIGRLTPIFVEGTLLNVCMDCEKFGRAAGAKASAPTPLDIEQRLAQRARRHQVKDIFDEAPESGIVEEYAKLIKAAREKKGWTHEELGNKAQERKSIIAKVESGGMEPSEALAKRLERVLGVKLIQKQG